MTKINLPYSISVGVGLLIGAVFSWALNSASSPKAPPSLDHISPSPQAIAPSYTETAATQALNASNLVTRLQRALSFESRNRRAWELELLFRNLSAATAPAIYQQLVSSPNYKATKEAFGPFWESWGKIDGEAAYATADTLQGDDKSTALKYILPSWAKEDALAVWALYTGPLKGYRNLDLDATNAIIHETARVSQDAVFSFANEANEPNQDRALRLALMKVASESNQLAQLTTRLEQFSDPGKRKAWAADIHQYWAGKDSAGALATIETIDDPELANAAMKGYLTGLYFADSTNGLETLFAMKETPVARNLLSELTPMIIGQRATREEKRAFIDRLEQEQLLDLFTQNINFTASWADPTLAIEIAEKLEAEERNALIQRTLSSWVHQDFDAAIAYYDGLSSTEEKVQFAPLFIDQLPRHSDGGANLATILGNLPHSQERAAIVETLLTRTKGARSSPSLDFLLALELISKSEPNLSAEAVAARDALFTKDTSE